MGTIGQIQLGKQRITDNFIESIKNHFKNHQNLKISVLRSARDSKESVKKYYEEILERLGKDYTAKIIGFTIILKKWRKAVR